MQRATPRVSRILETSLYVRDLERSRIFYERVFGFSTMFHDERMCALEVPGEQVLLLFAGFDFLPFFVFHFKFRNQFRLFA